MSNFLMFESNIMMTSFISFNKDILELGRDKLKEPFFLR